ncbi:hypothetical protein G6F31_020238 [Rhizopus arrhizus]|nr:hypothetical protein G6F31_020238 [Rhizopus arrhizus]
MHPVRNAHNSSFARQTELRGTKAVFGFHQLLHLPHTLHAHLAVRRTAACTDLRPGVLQLGFTAALGPRIGLPPGEMGVGLVGRDFVAPAHERQGLSTGSVIVVHAARRFSV